MSLSTRASLLTAILVGLLTVAPTVAHAEQPPPDDPGAGEAPEGEGEAPEGEGDEGAGGGSDAPPPEPDPVDDPPPEGAWGVGGTEAEGKYKPRGKTGKLKELEEDDEVEQERAEGPAELPAPGFAYLDVGFGFGEMVVTTFGPGATNIEPTASFLIGLGYRIGDTWQVGARFPISTGVNDGPNEPIGSRDIDKFTQIATGSLEIGVKPHFQLTREMRLPVGLAVTFPTGAGDLYPEPDSKGEIGQAIVNQAASAARGWRERALFAYKRFGIIPSGGIIWGDGLGPGKLNIRAETKVEILIKTSGGDAPPAADIDGDGEPDVGEEAEVRSTYASWFLGGDVYYDFLDGYIGAGLGLWFTVANAPEIKGTLDPGGFQFVFEPGFRTHVPFLEDGSFGLDGHVAFVLPAGGELGGDNQASANVWGLRVGAGFFFGP